MHALEMKKGTMLIHVVPRRDGSFHGEDVYRTGNRDLEFNDYNHLKRFAAKYNYTVTRFRNT